MQTQTYRIESYLRLDETHHFARKMIPPAPPTVLHDHDYYELVLVEKGSLVHWINGAQDALATGSLVFLRPSDRHALQADAGGCQIINVMFRPEIADHLGQRYQEDYAHRFFWTQGPRPATHHVTGPRFERAINQCLELQGAPRRVARIESFLLIVMNSVIEIFDHAARALPPWLRHACEQARLPEVFRDGAAGFVRAAGRGHEHVSRQTKAYLGVSPSTYVNRMRMEYAALVLGSEDAPIPQIADRCGIENLSHFYRLFRLHYGVTPRAYRLQHRRDPV